MTLVENWKSAWRWFSVQALAALTVLPLVWMALPSDAKSFLPDSMEPWVLFALAFGGIVGRLVDQKPKAPPK